LFLEVDRVRGDDDFEIFLRRCGQDGRHEIGKGFTHSRARFHKQLAFADDRLGNRIRHLELLRPRLKTGQAFCDQPIRAQNCVDIHTLNCGQVWVAT
jgi:hypothetical protein